MVASGEQSAKPKRSKNQTAPLLPEPVETEPPIMWPDSGSGFEAHLFSPATPGTSGLRAIAQRVPVFRYSAISRTLYVTGPARGSRANVKRIEGRVAIRWVHSAAWFECLGLSSACR